MVTISSALKNGNFNSHAHVERDKLEWTQICSKRDFNSHAHVERDVINHRLTDLEVNFNSHAHVERDFAFTPIEL